MRRLMRETKNSMMNYTEGERLVREATSNDAWLNENLFAQIARRMEHSNDRFLMKSMIWKRCSDFEHPNHVTKALCLIKFLVEYEQNEGYSLGGFVAETRGRADLVGKLRGYRYFRGYEEIGLCVRENAMALYAILFSEKEEKEEQTVEIEYVAKQKDLVAEKSSETHKKKQTKKKKVVKKKKIVKKKKTRAESRRFSVPKAQSLSPVVENRRGSVPAAAYTTFDEDDEEFDFFDREMLEFQDDVKAEDAVKHAPKSLFDDIESDIQNIRSEDMSSQKPEVVYHDFGHITRAPVVRPMSTMPQMRMPTTTDLLDVPVTYTRKQTKPKSKAKTQGNVKSLEQLMMMSQNKKNRENRKKKMPTLGEMVGKHGHLLETRKHQKPQEEVTANEANVMLFPEESIRVEASEPEKTVVYEADPEHEQPEEVMQIFEEVQKKPVIERELSKAQQMAKQFDKFGFDQEERRNSMPQATSNNDNYLVTGLRPVKPVHTSIYDE